MLDLIRAGFGFALLPDRIGTERGFGSPAAGAAKAGASILLTAIADQRRSPTAVIASHLPAISRCRLSLRMAGTVAGTGSMPGPLV